MDENFYTPKEAAKLLQVSYRTILREIHKGNLRAKKVGSVYIISKEDLETYEREGIVIRPLEVAVATVHNKKGEVLIVKRRKKEGKLKWQFPTGTIRYTETPKLRAEIECLQETGIHCKPYKFLGKRVHPDTKVIIYYWLCEYVSGEPTNVDEYENDEVLWATKEEAMKKFTSDVYPPLKKFMTEE
jgi:excisionase family DNA binding protein